MTSLRIYRCLKVIEDVFQFMIYCISFLPNSLEIARFLCERKGNNSVFVTYTVLNPGGGGLEYKKGRGARRLA